MRAIGCEITETLEMLPNKTKQLIFVVPLALYIIPVTYNLKLNNANHGLKIYPMKAAAILPNT